MEANDTVIRALVDLRDRTLQKSRVAFGLRISAVERGADKMDAGQQDILRYWHERFDELEADVDMQIRQVLKGNPIIESMTSVKGVGVGLAAKVYSMIDIEKCDTVSALWRYAGYAVIDGEREKPTKGEKLHYNNRLKTSCYLIGTSFLRSGSEYRKVYDDARDYYEANRPDWTKLHKHNASMRKMIKVWLAHLWEVWRTIEGLETRSLYVQERLGHNHITTPAEFGWKVAEVA